MKQCFGANEQICRRGYYEIQTVLGGTRRDILGNCCNIMKQGDREVT